LTVVKLEQATGKEQWRCKLGAYAAEHAVGASPIVYQDMVIVPNEQDGDSSIVALERQTGKIRWKAERRTEKTAYATPCLYVPENGPAQLIVNSWAHGFSALDPLTGKALWELPIFKNRVVGSPLVCSGLVIGSSGGGGIGRQMFAVRPGEPERGIDAEVVYELKGSLPYVVTPIACGDLLFSWFDKGVVTCLEIASGEVIWKERIGGDYFGSPVCVGGNLYCISREGQVVVLAASRQFEELGRVELGEASHSTPAVAGGVMYLRTKSHIMALGGK
jgi:outer membrane protein assembly factor BamB